jgi:hypothetical protein
MGVLFFKTTPNFFGFSALCISQEKKRKERKFRASLYTQGLHIAIGCRPYPTQKLIPSGPDLPLHNPNQVNGSLQGRDSCHGQFQGGMNCNPCDKYGVSCITTSAAE